MLSRGYAGQLHVAKNMETPKETAKNVRGTIPLRSRSASVTRFLQCHMRLPCGDTGDNRTYWLLGARDGCQITPCLQVEAGGGGW